MLCRSTVDAVFFAYVLRSYSRTNKYTAAILAYVLGAGLFTVAAAPNFARLFKRQQEDEGALRSQDSGGAGCMTCPLQVPAVRHAIGVGFYS